MARFFGESKIFFHLLHQPSHVPLGIGDADLFEPLLSVEARVSRRKFDEFPLIAHFGYHHLDILRERNGKRQVNFSGVGLKAFPQCHHCQRQQILIGFLELFLDLHGVRTDHQAVGYLHEVHIGMGRVRDDGEDIQVICREAPKFPLMISLISSI